MSSIPHEIYKIKGGFAAVPLLSVDLFVFWIISPCIFLLGVAIMMCALKTELVFSVSFIVCLS